MNILADENIDRQIIERLRADGHDVFAIAELAPGITDDEVLEMANARKAVLLTADKDFGELVYRLGRVAFGVVLLRPESLTPESRADLVSAALQRHGTEMLEAFSVIVPGAVRIRPKPS